VEVPSGTRLVALGLLLAALAPSSAQAAELVAAAPDEVRVPRGGLTSIEVQVSAAGVIGCGTNPSSPATARYDTLQSLVDARPAAGALPGDELPFYANNQLVLLPPLGCGVTWNGAPEPYRFRLLVAVASNVPEGAYTFELSADIFNPGGVGFAPLEDLVAEPVRVVVGPRLEGAADLPPPLEDRSINLLPVEGIVRVRYPGTGVTVDLSDPVQVPPGTGVNAEDGFVKLLSDATGRGDSQEATLWNDAFRVDYTRVLRPEAPGERRRAKAPITELVLRDGPPACGARSARAGAARKGKGLWARGRGRFRTRGRYGAGTVRGTRWFTRETCDGTLFRVKDGVVSVSDLTVRRSFAVGPGESYLVQPPDPRRGASRG
jgi:hypothetical protein